MPYDLVIIYYLVDDSWFGWLLVVGSDFLHTFFTVIVQFIFGPIFKHGRNKSQFSWDLKKEFRRHIHHSDPSPINQLLLVKQKWAEVDLSPEC